MSDYACKCGCGFDSPHPELVRCVEALRISLGVEAVTVVSGCRCETHNRSVGGRSKSRHLLGQAADIWVEGLTSEQVMREIVSLFGHTVYTYRIGWRAVHIDVRGRV